MQRNYVLGNIKCISSIPKVKEVLPAALATFYLWETNSKPQHVVLVTISYTSWKYVMGTV